MSGLGAVESTVTRRSYPTDARREAADASVDQTEARNDVVGCFGGSDDARNTQGEGNGLC
jgi:hypothetical protein